MFKAFFLFAFCPLLLTWTQSYQWMWGEFLELEPQLNAMLSERERSRVAFDVSKSCAGEMPRLIAMVRPLCVYWFFLCGGRGKAPADGAVLLPPPFIWGELEASGGQRR